jgi:radical SAM-linked protein
VRGSDGTPVRLRFTKLGKVRFVSHRDLARAFERAFRIERLPLAFTQGFSPRPKVSFGLALGVAHESHAEYLDFDLAEPVDIDALPDRLSPVLPEGVDVTGATQLTERAPSLQEAVTSVEVRLSFADLATDVLASAVDQALAADTLFVSTTRKGRAVVEDLRPALRRLLVTNATSNATRNEASGGTTVDAETATHPQGLRPSDLIRALRELAGATEPAGEDRVVRTKQWIERDGARLEPLEADCAAPTELSAGATSKGLNDDRRDDPGGDGLRTHQHPEQRADQHDRVGDELRESRGRERPLARRIA